MGYKYGELRKYIRINEKIIASIKLGLNCIIPFNPFPDNVITIANKIAAFTNQTMLLLK